MSLQTRARKGTAAVAEWSSYLLQHSGIDFISTGCTLLDCALGGGLAGGRIINIVGDKSTGKTLLAIEACANFARLHPKGAIRYKEAEAAFDRRYAQVLGMPLERVEFEEDFDTVEELFKDLVTFTTRCKKRKQPGIYIVDSLDALTDKAEVERDIEQGSYGAKKAALLSQMFRRLKRTLSEAKVTLLIISQVRDRIGVTFGRTWQRSGGKALDFYASQVIFLAETGKLKKTIKGMTRSVGVSIKAKIEKNKCGLPYREAEFSIKFGYGVDDLKACEEYLDKAKVKYKPTDKLQDVVRKTWHDVELSFLPRSQKYAD